MDRSLKRLARGAASTFLIALAITVIWAVHTRVAAHSFVHRSKGLATDSSRLNDSRTSVRHERNRSVKPLPAPIRFREVEGRGLVVKTWINNTGAYNFAIDTGAGATIISTRVAQEAGVSVTNRHEVGLTGLSGASGVSGREASLRSLAIGDSDNQLPARSLVIVTDALPSGLDGVLDPTESYWPLGYTIDLPAGEMSAFDPHTESLRAGDEPAGGAVVPWLFDGASRRPFVMLNNGRRALIDTGSSFGLAVSESSARSFGINLDRGGARGGGDVRDLSRSSVSSRRVAPATIQIGSLVLRGIPTDILNGTSASAPVLLGRDALSPFQLTFDPVNHLIRLIPR